MAFGNRSPMGGGVVEETVVTAEPQAEVPATAPLAVAVNLAVQAGAPPAGPPTGRTASPHPGREGPLSVDEENRLSRRWQLLGDGKALGRMVSAHLGLVIRIAQEFRGAGPPMEDLIQEGNMGLLIAARRFDPSRSARLATYATYWIRPCMMEYVVRSHGPVRIGTTRAQRKIFFGLGRARRRLEGEGRLVDADSLAALLGVERSEIDSMTPRLSGRDVPLDAPRGHEDSRQGSETLAEERPGPEEIVGAVEEDGTRRVRLRDALRILDQRERAIIRARHLCARPVTLGALGRKFGVSRERVRQLELRAMNKLRAFCGSNGLAPFDLLP